MGSVEIRGQRALTEAEVRGRVPMQPGMPFFEPLLAADRDAITAVYLDRGYGRAQVGSSTTPIPRTGARTSRSP